MQLSGVLVGFQFSLYRLRSCSVHLLILFYSLRCAERAEGDQERGGQRYRSVVDDQVQVKQLRPSYFPIDFDMIVDNDSSTGPTVCASGKHRKRARSGSQPSIGVEASAALWCAYGVPV